MATKIHFRDAEKMAIQLHAFGVKRGNVIDLEYLLQAMRESTGCMDKRTLPLKVAAMTVKKYIMFHSPGKYTFLYEPPQALKEEYP